MSGHVLRIILLIKNSLQQQFILMVICLGTNAVVVTRVHCIHKAVCLVT